jgi:hypothetical protein
MPRSKRFQWRTRVLLERTQPWTTATSRSRRRRRKASNCRRKVSSLDLKILHLATNRCPSVLADVVESLIGAAYLHGGFSLGYECIKFFDLGLKWEPLPVRIEQILSRVGAELDCYPPQLAYVNSCLDIPSSKKYS